MDKTGNLINARKYPEASTDYLEAGDLSAYSKEELKLMRNEIFAIHGYIFKTQSLKDYFSSQPWYSASYDNVDDLLSEVEKHNVQVIKQVEDSK
ncbi:MAG: YARHG domain-containing protein [Flammeovirgaceae bacterium]|nr:YARHG domain-containing protein [Flammeovirgaceae bacterium]